MDTLPLLIFARLCRDRHLPKDVVLMIHDLASLLPRGPSVDNSMLPDFLATWVRRGARLVPLWDDMSWVRQSREHVHRRHLRMRMALHDCFAVPEEGLWCEWHGDFQRSLLL